MQVCEPVAAARIGENGLRLIRGSVTARPALRGTSVIVSVILDNLKAGVDADDT